MKKPTIQWSKGEISRVRIVNDFAVSGETMLLTDAQVEEVGSRRADPNPRRLTLEEFKERLSHRLVE